RTALKKDPRFGVAHYHNALAQLRLNQFGPAAGSLRRAIELLPEGKERVAARIQLGDIYIAYIETVRRDYAEAVKRDRLVMQEVDRLCDELLALDSDSFDGHRLRGMLSL